MRSSTSTASLPLQDLVVLNEQIMLYINAGHYPAGKVETVRKNLLAYLRHLKTAKQQVCPISPRWNASPSNSDDR